MAPNSPASVAVIGGGAMGSAAAWQLALRGHRVVLFEQFGPGHLGCLTTTYGTRLLVTALVQSQIRELDGGGAVSMT